MLYTSWMVIVSGHNVKKQILETSFFERPRAKIASAGCVLAPWETNPPPPRTQYPNRAKKHTNTAYNVLYMALVVTPSLEQSILNHGCL